MRIDLNSGALVQAGRSDQASSPVKAETLATRQAVNNSCDVARLSTGSTALQQLKARLDAVPELRQQRVATLQQAVQSGAFHISPDSIATAMLAEAVGRA